MGVNLNTIVIKDELWNWSTAKVVNNAVKLTTYFDNPANKGIVYLTKQGALTADVETPVLLLIPAGLVEWLLIAQRSPWDLHKKITGVINDAGIANVSDKMKISLGWCLKAGQIPSRDAGSNTFYPTRYSHRI